MASQLSLRRSPGLPEVATAGALLALAGVAWVVTAGRMSGMDMGPNTDPGALGFFTGVWVVMMAAMMFPSAAPMVAVYSRISRRDGRGRELGSTPLFVAGYLALWTAAGVAGYLVAVAARNSGAVAWDAGGRYVAAGILAAAALYQLTPLKDRCLRKCRNPLGFVVTNWRAGRAGALRMGTEHGAWCLGCCWALMASLFALGIMSVAWMIFVAALIAGEKLLPWRAAANRGIALLLLALAAWIAVAPGSVPALSLPM
jgi:predicted metal-binding membrane protein